MNDNPIIIPPAGPVDKKVSSELKPLLCALGCEEIREGVFRHPHFRFDFDFTATDKDCILAKFYEIFAGKGYEKCQNDFKDVLGLPD